MRPCGPGTSVPALRAYTTAPNAGVSLRTFKLKVFPGDNERVIAFSILAFCAGSVLGIMTSTGSEYMVDGIVTLVTAFSGAYFAFRLNEYRRRETIKESNVNAANRAIFNLIKIYNCFGGYKRQFLQPEIDNPLKYVTVRPSIGFQIWMEDFDFDSLIYLVNSEEPNIVNELFEIQSEVRSTIEFLELRNALHYEKVQPKLEEAGFTGDHTVTREYINGIISERLASEMEELTETIIEFTDTIINKTESLISKMYDINSKLFKGKAIVKMKKLKKPFQQKTTA